MKKVYIVCFISLFLKFCNAQKSIKYTGIDRTLSLLQNSTKESPNNVEILFYGQSIIGGMRTDILIDSLKNIYPTAEIKFKHKPIGGLTVPKLIKTAEHDIYQENPDLIIFHAYGGIHDGLYDSLVKNIRSKMSSDILLLDHHYVWSKPESMLEAINIAHDRDSKGIERIAKKYDCEHLNVREQWKKHLTNNHIGVNELMGNTIDPNVHPNEKGNALLRAIIIKEFKKKPKIKYKEKKDQIRDSQNKINKTFFGSRVELITDAKLNNDAKIEVLIDGMTPSTFKSNYYIPRPSKGFKSWMPAILNITFGDTFPREEKWEIEIYDIDREGKVFKFKVYGNLTGFDGDGDSSIDYVSNSKRIKINKEDFYLFQSERDLTPENFKIHFSVKQVVNDTLVLNSEKSKYTLFRSFKNDNHHIDLNLISGNPFLEKILISKPFIDINE